MYFLAIKNGSKNINGPKTNDKNIDFYGYIIYIEDISIFINYSKCKGVFNLYIKISLNIYEMKIFHFLSYRLGLLQFFVIINYNNY